MHLSTYRICSYFLLKYVTIYICLMPTEKNPNFWRAKYERTFTFHIIYFSISFIQETLIEVHYLCVKKWGIWNKIVFLLMELTCQRVLEIL